MNREVVKIFENKERNEGVGAKVRRSIGTEQVYII